jgi:hypothetical protein
LNFVLFEHESNIPCNSSQKILCIQGVTGA